MATRLRLEYSIGSRTLTDILPSWCKDAPKDDISIAVRISNSGTENAAIILSSTDLGDSLISWFVLKNCPNVLVKVTQYELPDNVIA